MFRFQFRQCVSNAMSTLVVNLSYKLARLVHPHKGWYCVVGWLVLVLCTLTNIKISTVLVFQVVKRRG